MNPSITIAITYYNEKVLLTDCLRSLATQAIAPLEVIIFDDASTDRPDGYLVEGLAIRVIRSEENIGPGRARNELLKVAQGEWIHFHDSDDFFMPDWSKEVVERIRHQPTDVVFSEVTSYIDGKVLAENVIGFSDLSSDPNLVRFALQHIILVPCGTYRTEVIRKLGGYRSELWQSEDFDFHVRLAASKPRFEVIAKPLVGIRIRRESRSQNRAETRLSAFEAVQILRSELAEEYLADLAEVSARLGSELFSLGEKTKAHQAFLFAQKCGGAQFLYGSRAYRLLALNLGPEVAEKVGHVYRRIVPSAWRRALR